MLRAGSFADARLGSCRRFRGLGRKSRRDKDPSFRASAFCEVRSGSRQSILPTRLARAGDEERPAAFVVARSVFAILIFWQARKLADEPQRVGAGSAWFKTCCHERIPTRAGEIGSTADCVFTSELGNYRNPGVFAPAGAKAHGSFGRLHSGCGYKGPNRNQCDQCD